MLRSLLCTCLTGLLLTPVLGGEPKPEGSQSAATLEQKLASPAELELGDAEFITFGDLLRHFQQHHGVTVQLDRVAGPLVAGPIAASCVQKSLVLQIESASRLTLPGKTQVNPSAAPGPLYLESVQYFPASAAPACRTCAPSVNASVPPYYDPGQVYTSSPAPNDLVVSVADKPAGDGEDAPSVVEPVQLPAAEEADVSAQKAAPEESTAEVEDETPGTVHMPAVFETVFRRTEISTATLRADDLTVEQALRRALSQVTTFIDLELSESGLPASYTHAYDWDLLVQDDCVFISTVLQSNLHKTARVYRLPEECDLTSEDLATVVRKTIRPWSWVQQIDDVVNMVQIELPEGGQFPQLPSIKKIDLTGEGDLVQFEEVAEAASPNAIPSISPDAAWMSLKATGSLMSSGTLAAAHTLVNTAEMLHFADPPTATIQVLPGMLIISHSRGGHREIADLIEQLTTAK